MDVSPRMIERAGAWPGTPGNAEFRVGEAGRLPAEDGAFSAVLCTNALHHYPDPEAAAGEMARALERGGRLVIGDGCADIRAPLDKSTHTLSRFKRSMTMPWVGCCAPSDGLSRAMWSISTGTPIIPKRTREPPPR